MKKLLKLLYLLPHKTFRDALRFGVAAAIEHIALLSRLECNLIVDVGANRGQFALTARKCFPSATIISFEPLHKPMKIMRDVFINDQRIELYQFAIGSEKKKATINISRRDDSSSLLPITNLQEKIFPGTAYFESETINVERLDNIITKESITTNALLKLDIQGYELEALVGCGSILDSFEYIYVECSFLELYQGQVIADEIIEYLQDRKYKLRGVYNLTYDKNRLAVQGDFFFTKQSVSV